MPRFLRHPVKGLRLYSTNTRPRKSAIITGGASGLGLRVARELSARGDWHVHIVDKNAEAGAHAVRQLDGMSSSFHQVDVTQYGELSTAFRDAFQHSGGRLDFVLANAGVAGLEPIYRPADTTGSSAEPPPPIDLTTVRILYDSAIYSWYLAMHYFQQSGRYLAPTHGGYDPNIVMTASCMGLYAPMLNPIYTGAKHGVVGFMRAVAPYSWTQQGVRVNALCPGSFRSGILSREAWAAFPAEAETPMDKVAEAALILLAGKDPYPPEQTRIDGRSGPKDGGVLWGEALEISGNELFYRDAPPASNSTAESLLKIANRRGV